jgi:hypothetical protein
MIGARHTAGSTISNGGDRSPLSWVIVGAVPGIRRSGHAIPARKSGFLCRLIVGNRSHSAKRKKRKSLCNISGIDGKARLH